MNIWTKLTIAVLKRQIGSILHLLMSWQLMLPGHQQQWHWHQTITWTNIDLQSTGPFVIHWRPFLQDMLKKSIANTRLKIINLKSTTTYPRDQGVRWDSTVPGYWQHRCVGKCSHLCSGRSCPPRKIVNVPNAVHVPPYRPGIEEKVDMRVSNNPIKKVWNNFFLMILPWIF